MKVVAIIQARIGSTRLPGKVLKKILGKSLLDFQLERLRQVNNIDEIVIATTTNVNDLPVVEWCKQNSISFYRGSEEDVLSRYYEAATIFNADIVVRLTSDCPLIDPKVVETVINHYITHKESVDYVSNSLIRTFPRGLDTEVMSYSVLKQVHMEAISKPHREHVTAYIYSHPERFKLLNVSNNLDQSRFRLTVDTIEDFQLIRNIIEELYPQNQNFDLNDIIALLERNKEWFLINQHIEQKSIDSR
jgi:spore coat polysaccharide biosynthesis protein SpsF